MSTGATPIKIDPATDRIVTQAAHFLGRPKKDLVDVAVREYVQNHRDEITAAVHEALGQLDGSVGSSVALLTGFDADKIAELGGGAPNP